MSATWGWQRSVTNPRPLRKVTAWHSSNLTFIFLQGTAGSQRTPGRNPVHGHRPAYAADKTQRSEVKFGGTRGRDDLHVWDEENAESKKWVQIIKICLWWCILLEDKHLVRHLSLCECNAVKPIMKFSTENQVQSVFQVPATFQKYFNLRLEFIRCAHHIYIYIYIQEFSLIKLLKMFIFGSFYHPMISKYYIERYLEQSG